MEQTERAAVIHPTGTGKSFIAFKLAEEHPTEKICWLAPSAYIFQTQLLNLQEADVGNATLAGKDADTEGYDTNIPGGNITFLTYAKLMMNEEIIETLTPDYIILDEFHRCGAAEWGKSVEKLLAAYPKAKVLGLSATNVRYLDGQRDMAEELFDGKIASEMTLGEAIAREILPAPTYVVSMYAWGEEWKRLQKRIQALPNAGLRSANEELLEQLRRALQKAEGLRDIFARHMKSNGKYLVFCSDYEHMEEMLAQVPEWFGKVDEEPHLYRAYYDNPKTEQEFATFKSDNSSHLKLLFSIDMLNEGVHIPDIDGVVLLRPTVSPILYLQQIGRALSTGTRSQKSNGGGVFQNNRPVIFDIVNNFESLSCIDSLQGELEEAWNALLWSERNSRGEKREFSERFRIYDEVRECRDIFAKLQRNLSASWEIYYAAASSYYKEHGNLNVPKKYVTEDGLTLGSWLQTQRRVRDGRISGSLTKEQEARLESIGMNWESKAEQSFRRGYDALTQYKMQYGNLDIRADYITEENFALGKWVANLRQKRNGKCGRPLTKEQVEQLDALGMIWDKNAYQWNCAYEQAASYYKEHGNLEVPYDYVTEENFALGNWIQNQRKIYAGKKAGASSLSEEQIRKLEKLGMSWQKRSENIWDEKYVLARQYYEEHGNLEIPSGYCVGNIQLGKWIASVRMKRQNPASSGRKLTEERVRELDAIGMRWS